MSMSISGSHGENRTRKDRNTKLIYVQKGWDSEINDSTQLSVRRNYEGVCRIVAVFKGFALYIVGGIHGPLLLTLGYLLSLSVGLGGGLVVNGCIMALAVAKCADDVMIVD
ncbi:hypothetical protein O6P43_012403 [Quillaja saponaria]|uniref:Uncharacterized protein n=1 Tax=Quillaja saponaria TaxID=32244 RepID=A0AAD7M1L2_QUISA|nr:hypothetical protein O6P43_012403 [Quillaja saponaria]